MTDCLELLSSTPTALTYADSSLSSTLISILAALLPRSPATTVSIGYGHGLLEAYLMRYDPAINLLGIDVVRRIPQFIGEENTRILCGTHTTSVEAMVAEAWLFVYPKDLGLLGKYVRKYEGGMVRIAVWIGPRMDWEEIEKGIPREGWTREVPEDNGLKAYEALVVWRKGNVVEKACDKARPSQGLV
ncbi:MAG: hypothetical protein Q9170_005246 [Blastenia crenularia]